MDIYPPTLRISPLDWYREHPNAVQSRHPAMFALVTDPTGKHIATHRTFLADDGIGKANVATPFEEGERSQLLCVHKGFGDGVVLIGILNADSIAPTAVRLLMCFDN
jgi:hypothetical protein